DGVEIAIVPVSGDPRRIGRIDVRQGGEGGGDERDHEQQDSQGHVRLITRGRRGRQGRPSAISPTTRTRTRSELPGRYASGRSSTSTVRSVARAAPAVTARSSAIVRPRAIASSRGSA